MRMRAPSLSGTSKAPVGAGTSNCIDTRQRTNHPRGLTFAIRTFAVYLAMRYGDRRPPGQRLILDGNQGFVSPVSQGERGVGAAWQTCGSQGRPGVAVGSRPLCR